jgi:uncharacterized membrane protein (DUF4010 family)
MAAATNPTTSVAVSLAIGIALAFFFGLAFEEAYATSSPNRPGGVRTFPLLAIAGFVLYSLEPVYGLVFVAGLIVLGWWLLAHYRSSLAAEGGPQGTGAEIVIPLCNLLAYALGPIALVEPPWLAVGVAVVAVLLLNARDWLHALARRIPVTEITTLGKFLVLIGVVLPLAPRTPITALTPITPRQAWLAVVVVSSLSYGSYLLQRLGPKRRSALLAAVLGGLYSSTATTVVLSRQAADGSLSRHELNAGVTLATAMMYLRVGVVVAIFDRGLALALAPVLGVLFLVAVALAAGCYALGRRRAKASDPIAPPRNPLEIGAALLFAVLFVVISLLSRWVEQRFGHNGIYTLAAIVGVTDIDPFLLSLVQGSVQTMTTAGTGAAIIVAASSNDVLKAAYTIGFAGRRAVLPAVASLLLLAAAGAGLALWMVAG